MTNKSSPCAAEKSISGCGLERADIQRSLSLLKEKKTKIAVSPATVTANTDVPLPWSHSLTVCQSEAAGLCATCAAETGSSGGSEV